MNKKRFSLYAVVLLLGQAAAGYSWNIGLFASNENAENVAISHPSRLPGSATDLSSHIFVGKVIEQSGTVSRSSLPETQFSVEVITSIKGNLEKTVTVNQNATGYKEGKLFVVQGAANESMEGNDATLIAEKYLLQPGSTYVFAARYSKAYDWYTVLSHEGFTLITKDASLTNQELHNYAGNHELARKWQAALE